MRDRSTLKTLTIRDYEISFFPSSIRSFVFSVSDMVMAFAILTTIQNVESTIPLWAPIWTLMKVYYVVMSAGSLIHNITNKTEENSLTYPGDQKKEVN